MNGRAYKVVENTEVLSDYIAIAEHITRWTGDLALADRTVDAIRDFIKSLGTLPHRGVLRDDLHPALRLIPFGKRSVIACEIDEDGGVVTVLRVFYGGQDYEAIVGTPPP